MIGLNDQFNLQFIAFVYSTRELFISMFDRFTVFLCTLADEVDETEESVSESEDETFLS